MATHAVFIIKTLWHSSRCTQCALRQTAIVESRPSVSNALIQLSPTLVLTVCSATVPTVPDVRQPGKHTGWIWYGLDSFKLIQIYLCSKRKRKAGNSESALVLVPISWRDKQTASGSASELQHVLLQIGSGILSEDRANSDQNLLTACL